MSKKTKTYPEEPIGWRDGVLADLYHKFSSSHASIRMAWLRGKASGWKKYHTVYLVEVWGAGDKYLYTTIAYPLGFELSQKLTIDSLPKHAAHWWTVEKHLKGGYLGTRRLAPHAFTQMVRNPFSIRLRGNWADDYTSSVVN